MNANDLSDGNAVNVVNLNNEPYNVQDLVSMKVFFPMSRADFDSSSGMDIQVLASEQAKAACDSGNAKGMYEVVLDSDALEGIGLHKGDILPVELHEGGRPVVLWGFVKKYK